MTRGINLNLNNSTQNILSIGWIGVTFGTDIPVTFSHEVL